jgi:hypothetical protein
LEAGEIVDKKSVDLTLLVVSFGAFMVLVLTRLSFVLEYSSPRGDTNSSSFLDNSHGVLPEALFLGFLMIVLLASSIFFFVRLVRSNSN